MLCVDGDFVVVLKGVIYCFKVEYYKLFFCFEIVNFLEVVDKYGGYCMIVIVLWLMLLMFVCIVEF